MTSGLGNLQFHSLVVLDLGDNFDMRALLSEELTDFLDTLSASDE